MLAGARGAALADTNQPDESPASRPPTWLDRITVVKAEVGTRARYLDEGLRKVGTTLRNGTIFRVIEFAPGLAARNHRTDSIDYIVVISGEIDMELDDSVVHLKAGDVMVQRGTIHNWVNRGTAPCVLAVILVDAKSVEVGGNVLHAAG